MAESSVEKATCDEPMSGIANLTEDEAALYDRQIRLWGLEAQNRLKNAEILLVGVTPLGAEVAKNLMLAGLKSLTLLDDHSVNELDLKLNYFVDRATALHKNRAEAVIARCQKLNPLVKLTAVPVEKNALIKKVKELMSSRSYDLVCCVDRGIDECLKISAACRKASKSTPFMMGGVSGWFGYCFNDFGDNYEYASEEFAPTSGKDAGETSKGLGAVDECLCLDEPDPKKSRLDESADTVPKNIPADAAPKNPAQPAEKLKIIVRKHTSFTSFEDIFKVRISGGEGDVKRKRTRLPYPVGFYLFQVLAAFHYRYRRYPKMASKSEDAKSLRFEKNSISSQWGDLKVDIPDSFAESLFDQVPAVCAIVGGVIGQEAIKAVSKKDDPINNMFFYNPFDSSGCIATIPQR